MSWTFNNCAFSYLPMLAFDLKQSKHASSGSAPCDKQQKISSSKYHTILQLDIARFIHLHLNCKPAITLYDIKMHGRSRWLSYSMHTVLRDIVYPNSIA